VPEPVISDYHLSSTATGGLGAGGYGEESLRPAWVRWILEGRGSRRTKSGGRRERLPLPCLCLEQSLYYTIEQMGSAHNFLLSARPCIENPQSFLFIWNLHLFIFYSIDEFHSVANFIKRRINIVLGLKLQTLFDDFTNSALIITYSHRKVPLKSIIGVANLIREK
jgi:hypothetical protein